MSTDAGCAPSVCCNSRFTINVKVLYSSLYCCSNFASKSARTWLNASFGCGDGYFGLAAFSASPGLQLPLRVVWLP
ncbi:MAG: hypothetical protein EZS28_018793 [Streblomastix strix]|uniref:Uncharacterized protein n=1 Tax=Streblomastix strix TaxID=222440 RepID=A0A5J4VT97_9EUKA|nr:MAG: hypothetical protein EZS28_018793 [Streblomastix strix]